MKVVWLVTALITLWLTLTFLQLEDSFALVLIAWLVMLLAGLVLNFSPVTKGTKWGSLGWGMFYGAVSFAVFAVALFILLASQGIQC